MAENRRRARRNRTEQSQRQVKRIGVLPDDILLEIFDFYVGSQWDEDKAIVEEWQLLVHVCQRWRSLVFQSPHRLNLRLYCTPKTPAKDTLDIWPAFPLIVWGNMLSSSGIDNIIAALGQHNRVSQVYLTNLASWQLEAVLATMQVPFLGLEDLWLHSADVTPPVIPDSLLNGSAPHLHNFQLYRISFPGLTKLLLTSSRLVTLWLELIPHSGYISPEEFVSLFSVLSSLEDLSLSFESPRSHPGDRLRSSQPPKRSTLSALRVFKFRGVTEYLEELVIRIGTPQLYKLEITFFNQIDFNTPRLAQFINRTPRLRALDEVHVYVVVPSIASIGFQHRASEDSFEHLSINISCVAPDWQLSSIEQVCNSLCPLSTVEDLYIEGQAGMPLPVWKDDPIENTLWLQLLLPFSAVKNLYLSVELAARIAATLKELVTGRATEILPSLQNIFVAGLDRSGPLRENIEQFVAARQLSDNPIAISHWHQRLNALMRQLPLREGRIVAFHPPSTGKGADGTIPDDTTWIMARIVKSFHQDKFRYEVEDIEPEDGKPLRYPALLRSTPFSIIPLPDKDASPGSPAHIGAYQEFPTGATVMALYPDTSCFYRAEVIASPRDFPTPHWQRRGYYRTYYKLKFEDDDDQEHLIPAAEVLEWPGQ